MLSNEHQQQIINTLSKFEPRKIGIFGSYARGEESTDSDLDILVDFKKNVNLLDLVGLEQELSELLGVKVDLVTERSVNPRLKDYIQQDLRLILE